MQCSGCGRTFNAAKMSVCGDCGAYFCPDCRTRANGLCPHCCGHTEHLH